MPTVKEITDRYNKVEKMIGKLFIAEQVALIAEIEKAVKAGYAAKEVDAVTAAAKALDMKLLDLVNGITAMPTGASLVYVSC